MLVIELEGRLDTPHAPELDEDVEALIQDDDRAVVFDMRRLEYINSSGMRSILGLVKKLETRDTKFAVCSLIGTVREMFRISGFDRVITVRSTKSEAIAAINE